MMRRLCTVVLIVIAIAACQSSESDRDAAPTTSSSSSTTSTTVAVERIVYVYREDAPVDALPAAPLGLLLPVPQCGTVPPETLDAVRKLRATGVRRVGGPEAVCDDVIRQLQAAVSRR